MKTKDKILAGLIAVALVLCIVSFFNFQANRQAAESRLDQVDALQIKLDSAKAENKELNTLLKRVASSKSQQAKQMANLKARAASQKATLNNQISLYNDAIAGVQNQVDIANKWLEENVPAGSELQKDENGIITYVEEGTATSH